MAISPRYGSRQPKDLPARAVLVYLCVFISLGSASGVLFQEHGRHRFPRAAHLSPGLAAAVSSVRIFVAPTSQDTWSGCAETAVIVAGAWVLYAWTVPGGQRLGFATGDGLRIASALRPSLDPLRRGALHQSQRDRCAGAWLAAMARGLGVLHRLCLHRSGRDAPVCMRGWRPFSQRCNWACSHCLCGCPSWRQT